MKCDKCHTDHHGKRYKMVWRYFKNWSGTWSNSVVCDGITVAGHYTLEEALNAYEKEKAKT